MIRSALLTLMLCIVLSPSVYGVVLVADDFESATVDLQAPNPPWEGLGTAGNYVIRGDNTATPFGPDNQWLEAGSFSNGGLENGRVTFSPVTLLTVSFDAYFDINAFTGFMRLAIRGEQPGFEANLGWIDWNGGAAELSSSAGDFALDTAEHYDIVINITGSTVNYESTTVANDTYDLWQNGVLILDDVVLEFNDVSPNSSIQEIGFWQLGSGGSESQTWLDNVLIQDTPFVVAAGQAGDADGDGDVDGEDFLSFQRDDPSQIPLWRSNYPAPLSGISAVPEPGSIGLIASAMILGMAMRRGLAAQLRS